MFSKQLPCPLLRIAVVFSLLLASPILAEDWTHFRGSDYGRTSVTNVPLEWDSTAVTWKTALQGRGASCPVVFDGRIYLTSYTGYGISSEDPGDPTELERQLMAIKLQDGTIQWQQTIPSTSPKNPTNNWGAGRHGYASSTPAVDKTGVYVFLGATGVLAFSHDGEELWRTNVGTGTHVFGAGNSPVLYKDMVIINASVESGDLIALAKDTGEVVWRQSGISDSWNTPVIYQNEQGKHELAVTIKGKIVGFSPDDGKPLWTCDGIPDYICPSIIVEDGILFATGGRRSEVIAIRSGGQGDVTNSHTLWRLSKAGSNVSSPVYVDGFLYLAKEQNGIVYCINAKTGDTVYSERLTPKSGLIYASPLLADGRLYFVSREQGIYVVAAKPEFELIAHTTLNDDTSIFNASPVPLPGGDILLRSDKFVYRLSK